MKKNILAHITRQLLPLLLLCGLAGAENTPQLLKLRHTVLSPTTEQVVLQLNGSYSPKVFTLKDETPRVIFDFADMTHGRDVNSVTTTNGAIIKRVRVGMHTDPAPKTRVVFDVTTLKGVNHTQRFDEKSSTLIVEFTQPAKAAPAKPKPVANNDGQQAQPTAATPLTADIKPTTDSTPAQPAAMPEKAKADPFAAPKPPPEATAEAPAAITPPATTAEKKTAPVAEKTTSPAQAPVEEKKAAPSQPQPEPVVDAKTPVKTTPAPTDVQSQAKIPAKETVVETAGETQKEAAEKPPQSSEQPAAPAAVADGKVIAKTEAPPTEEKAGTGAGKTAPPAKAEEGAQLHSIKFDATSPKGEMVLFKLNGFHPPVVQGVEEGIPRVICDFNNTKLTDSTKKLIKADGKFVKKIRTSETRKPEKVRVVLDLEPNRSYDLQQVFFKEDNLFVIIVNTVKK